MIDWMGDDLLREEKSFRQRLFVDIYLIPYRLGKLWRRLFGQCFHMEKVGDHYTKTCLRAPTWYAAQAGAVDHWCDEHVRRGCCWPNGTTVCADNERLPWMPWENKDKSYGEAAGQPDEELPLYARPYESYEYGD